MNKWIRIVVFMISVILFYFTFSTIQNKFASMLLIAFVALMLCSMEVVRKKRDNLFKMKSETVKIKGLKQEELILYMAELFKRLGYYVDPIPKDKDKGADFVMRKGKQVICVKCDEQSEAVLIPLQQVVGSMKCYRANKSMVISRGYFTREMEDYARENHIILIDNNHLIEFIEKVIGSKEESSEKLKAQEV